MQKYLLGLNRKHNVIKLSINVLTISFIQDQNFISILSKYFEIFTSVFNVIQIHIILTYAYARSCIALPFCEMQIFTVLAVSFFSVAHFFFVSTSISTLFFGTKKCFRVHKTVPIYFKNTIPETNSPSFFFQRKKIKNLGMYSMR